MIEKDTEICVCNSVTAQELADFIKENKIKSLDELLKHPQCNVADKCEACKDEGFYNDGINLPLVIKLVWEEKL